jgi:mRNA interferase RelE/StbE
LAWQIEWDEEALKELKKLGHTASKSLVSYLENRIATDEDPRRFGKALTGDKVGLWRYRVGDYRIICRIEDEIIVVLVLRVGHRRDIYDS